MRTVSVASTASSASAGIMEMMAFSSHHPVLIIHVVSTRVCSVTNNGMELQPGSLPKNDEDMSPASPGSAIQEGGRLFSYLGEPVQTVQRARMESTIAKYRVRCLGLEHMCKERRLDGLTSAFL